LGYGSSGLPPDGVASGVDQRGQDVAVGRAEHGESGEADLCGEAGETIPSEVWVLGHFSQGAHGVRPQQEQAARPEHTAALGQGCAVTPSGRQMLEDVATVNKVEA